MSKQSFIQGTMILLAAGIFSRILGFVPRIMLPRFMGAEGIGLYQLGYPLLILILTLITGGLPLAVAKLVAQAESEGNSQKIKTILRTALSFAGTLGTLFMLAAWAGASWITSHLLTDDRVYLTFLTMAPIILIVSLSSVLRGYFQGKHNMIPTALSTTMETVIRCGAMLTLSYCLLPYGLDKAAAGAMAGVLLGELAGLAVLLIQCSHKRSSARSAAGTPNKAALTSLSADPSAGKAGPFQMLRQLLTISIPVTASKLVGSASYFLESILIVQSLAVIGVTAREATALYGTLTGMIIPVMLLPTALTYSLSVSLVPSLSEAAAKQDFATIRKRMLQSIRIALVTGVPFAVIMFMLSEPLCLVLYQDAAPAVYLKWMAPIAIFIYLQGPLQAALQALDQPGTALLNTFIGAAVKLTLIYVLAAKAGLGIEGAIAAICLNMMLVTALHWNSVSRLIRFRLQLREWMVVLLGSMMMVLFISIATRISPLEVMTIEFLLISFLSTMLYVLVMIAFGMINRADLMRVPWIGRLFK
ncbi:stage V sporulation protein B [Marinicrinis sediminis]|uniref:Stage V sporulation protein B n=1 Tax=Marinicrinis sediminis TaxID=1652465 RepID=A0ABW5R6V1_9BACL